MAAPRPRCLSTRSILAGWGGNGFSWGKGFTKPPFPEGDRKPHGVSSLRRHLKLLPSPLTNENAETEVELLCLKSQSQQDRA